MNIKHSVICFLIICLLAKGLNAQNLFDNDLDLYNDEASLFSEDKELFDPDLSLFDEQKNIYDEDKSLFDNSKNTISNTENGYSIYDSIYSDGTEATITSIYEKTTISYCEDIYIGRYGEYLEATSNNPIVRQRFVNYFSDWQQLGFKEDFFQYSKNRAETEKQIEYCYNAAIKKFGIGTAIVATTWIVAYVVPGGTIYQAAILVIAKATTVNALSGAMVGGITSAGISLLKGKTAEEILYSGITGAADGYLIGSITGLFEGSTKVYRLAKESKSLKYISESKTIFNNRVYDINGKEIGRYYPGEIISVDGKKLHLAKDVKNAGDKSKMGITYKYYLADDGKGNYFKVLMPDFDDVKVIKKTYKVPQFIEKNGKRISLWKNDRELKKWCKEQYLKDLRDPTFLKTEGISQKEALLRIQFEEKGKNFFDYESKEFQKFISDNDITMDEVYDFLEYYEGGDWHHLASSGEMIYVPRGHGSTWAPHTGGNKFWCDQAEVKIQNGTNIITINKR